MVTLKKVWSVISTVIVILMVVCAVFLMGSRLIGFQCYNIISPSMEPEYSVGDLIYVKDVDPSTVKVGDVITFVVNEDLVVGTHRVVRIDNEKKHFITKGDMNDTEDPPVHFKNLIGVPEFAIPKLGYVSDFIQNPPGMYITIAVGALLILLVFLPDMFGKKKATVSGEAFTAEGDEDSEQTKMDAISEENEKLRAELERLRAEKEALQGSTEGANEGVIEGANEGAIEGSDEGTDEKSI